MVPAFLLCLDPRPIVLALQQQRAGTCASPDSKINGRGHTFPFLFYNIYIMNLHLRARARGWQGGGGLAEPAEAVLKGSATF